MQRGIINRVWLFSIVILYFFLGGTVRVLADEYGCYDEAFSVTHQMAVESRCSVFFDNDKTFSSYGEHQIDNKKQLKVAFLNAFNLFDTINAPNTQDGEFTPTGSKQWDTKKYQEKIALLGSTIKTLNADILGLCEVENREVVADVVRESGLRYHIIHYDSRDARGIDLALIYNPEKLTVKESELITISTETPTRELLYAKAIIEDKPYSIYCAHLPSKRGGRNAEKNRQQIIDSLQKHILQSDIKQVIVMGDMNTEKPLEIPYTQNLTESLAKRGFGTYNYRGVWSMIDQLLVSHTLHPQITKVQIFQVRNNPNKKAFNNKMQISDHNGVYFVLKL